MSFNPETAKTASGFTLPTTTATNSGVPTFQFGSAGGDAKTTKPALSLFDTTNAGVSLPSSVTFGKTPTSSTSVISGGSATGSSTLPQYSVGNTAAATALLNFSSVATRAPSPSFTVSGASTAVATTTSLAGFPPSSTVKPTTVSSSTALTFGSTSSSTAATSTTASTTITTTTASSALPSTGVSTFAQLEDAINKWTIDLEEHGKQFANQGKQINAWDRLLISNGEKILSLNNGIERVKQQQQQLDQELDFVLAQQKELEELLVPLEKELATIPVTDQDRNRTYQMAENLDYQLKQMSEDLKEIIEHLNEANKNQELSNPIIQIGRILNAHMNSLQWIDRNTTKISTHLDQITKMHDMNKRNHEINLQKTYE